jgi:predicted GTPase
MKMIAGDLTVKLCEMIPSCAELSNVGNGRKYVARPSLEDLNLQASEQSLEEKGGVCTIIIVPKGAGKSSAVARVLSGEKGVVSLLISDTDHQGQLSYRCLNYAE